MGMTDRQFNAYQRRNLRILKKTISELKEKGVLEEDLKELQDFTAEIEEELRLP